jgi:hypothetical protein
MPDSFKALLPIIISAGVFDYFEMSNFSKTVDRLDLFLEEINIIPVDY